MKFTNFDNIMRKYEQSLDQVIANGNYIIARLDGRSFHTFVKNENYDRPFDYNLKERMLNTMKNLIKESKFDIRYAYTQSDEISLLLDLNDDTFGRKVRKINSVLASCAAAYFNSQYYQYNNIANPANIGVFDCRVIPLPNKDLVKDYFVWRQEDCTRNCLNSYIYWTLRKEGCSIAKAVSKMDKMKFSEKHDFLHERGLNFNDFPDWQKRGVAVYWHTYQKKAIDINGKEKICLRRKIYINEHLHYGEEYAKWVIDSFACEKGVKNV